MDKDFFNPLPTLAFAKWLDVDVLSSLLMYVMVNTDSSEAALEVLKNAPLKKVGKHYQLRDKDSPTKLDQDQDVTRYFGVGMRYLPGICYDIRRNELYVDKTKKKITSLVWDEFKDQVSDPNLKEIYQDWLAFLESGTVDDGEFSATQDFMLLEQVAVSLRTPTFKLHANLAIGPSSFPSYVGFLVDKYLRKESSESDYRALLIDAYLFVRKWVDEELDLRQLLKDNPCRQVNDLIDVVAINSMTMPLARLRYLYKKYYRWRMKKYFFLVFKEENKGQENMWIYKFVPDTISSMPMYYLRQWLMREFDVPKTAFASFDNFSVMKVCLYKLQDKPDLAQVANYIEGYCLRNVREQMLKGGQERCFYKTRKLLRNVLDFRGKYQSHLVFYGKSIDLLNMLVGKLRSEKDLEILTEYLSNYQSGSDSWSELGVLGDDDDGPVNAGEYINPQEDDQDADVSANGEDSNSDDDSDDSGDSPEYSREKIDSDELNSVFSRPRKF